MSISIAALEKKIIAVNEIAFAVDFYEILILGEIKKFAMGTAAGTDAVFVN